MRAGRKGLNVASVLGKKMLEGSIQSEKRAGKNKKVQQKTVSKCTFYYRSSLQK